jgi:hypothetical protein
MLSEQRRQQLFAKLGRETLFSTIEERNQWIKEEQRFKLKFFKEKFMLILSISQYSKISTLVLQGEEKLHYISEGMKREESKAKELEIVIKVRWRNKNLFIFLFLNLYIQTYFMLLSAIFSIGHFTISDSKLKR